MKTKSFLKLSFAIATFTLGVTSCENETETTNQETTVAEIPEKIIPVSKAINEYNNFYNTRIAPLQNETATKDNRAVWYDLQTLENYLQKIETVTQQKGIEITNLGFVLGVDSNNKRTVFLAPMTFDSESGINRAFSIDNDKITFLHASPFDNHAKINNEAKSATTNQSLILSSDGYISSAKAVTMYNNYYDSKLKPLTDVIENDTRICFYEKGVFKNYLTYIKQQAANNNINVSGINMVFGVYGKDASFGAYANHQTLFFAPTTSEAKSQNNNSSYTLVDNKIIILDFSQTHLEKIVSKFNGLGSTSIANEVTGTPPMGR